MNFGRTTPEKYEGQALVEPIRYVLIRHADQYSFLPRLRSIEEVFDTSNQNPQAIKIRRIAEIVRTEKKKSKVTITSSHTTRAYDTARIIAYGAKLRNTIRQNAHIEDYIPLDVTSDAARQEKGKRELTVMVSHMPPTEDFLARHKIDYGYEVDNADAFLLIPTTDRLKAWRIC